MTFSKLSAFGLTVLLSATLISPLATATEAFSGAEDLHSWCANMKNDDVHWGLCVGSITAVHDTIMSYQALDDMNQIVCTKSTTSRGELVIAVRDYMQEHPEVMGLSLGDVVLYALHEAFPCQ